MACLYGRMFYLQHSRFLQKVGFNQIIFCLIQIYDFNNNFFVIQGYENCAFVLHVSSNIFLKWTNEPTLLMFWIILILRSSEVFVHCTCTC